MYDKSAPKGAHTWHTHCDAPSATKAPGALPWLPEGVQYSLTSVGAHWFRCDSLRAGFELSNSINPGNKHTHESAGHGSSGDWYGAGSFANALKIIEAGAWPEGVDRMQKALGDLGATLKPQSVRRVRRWSDNGDSVEMSRVWAGRVDVAWQRCHRAQRRGPQSVVIVVKIGGVSSVSAERLFWRGAAALKLADLLTEAGYNVELEAAHTSTHVSSGDGFAVSVPIKEATAPLDLNSLAVVVSLAGFFRYTVFRQMCACPGSVSSGFGSTCRYRELVTKRDDDRTAILLDEEAHDKASARAWIEAQIATLEAMPLAA